MSVQLIQQRAGLVRSTIVWLLIRLRVALTPKPKLSDGKPQVFPTNLPPDYGSVQQVRLTSLDLQAHATDFAAWNVCCVEAVKTKRTARTVVYLHGGAYVNGIQPAHWWMCARLARDLDARVYVVPYPLVTATIKTVMVSLVKLYSIIHEDSTALGHEIIIAGDSAGAGLSVGLAHAVLDQTLLCPDQLFLISPWLDVSNSVPGIERYRRRDPWLRPDVLAQVGKIWSAGEVKSSYCSPIYGDLPRLARANVRVTMCSGTYDYLYSNALEWASRCTEARVSCTFLSAERCVHVYPLLAFSLSAALVAESAEALTLMIESVKGFSSRKGVSAGQHSTA